MIIVAKVSTIKDKYIAPPALCQTAKPNLHIHDTAKISGDDTKRQIPKGIKKIPYTIQKKPNTPNL